jgi:hypothetical protein
LKDFAIEKLGVVENNIVAMMDKLDIFERSLRRDDESILHRLYISEGMQILERISIGETHNYHCTLVVCYWRD